MNFETQETVIYFFQSDFIARGNLKLPRAFFDEKRHARRASFCLHEKHTSDRMPVVLSDVYCDTKALEKHWGRLEGGVKK